MAYPVVSREWLQSTIEEALKKRPPGMFKFNHFEVELDTIGGIGDHEGKETIQIYGISGPQNDYKNEILIGKHSNI